MEVYTQHNKTPHELPKDAFITCKRNKTKKLVCLYSRDKGTETRTLSKAFIFIYLHWAKLAISIFVAFVSCFADLPEFLPC